MTTYMIAAILFSIGSGVTYSTLARKYPDSKGRILLGMMAANFLVASIVAEYTL